MSTRDWLAVLIEIQRLCARNAPLELIWETAEKAIRSANSRH
jgi:hypothetical protein